MKPLSILTLGAALSVAFTMGAPAQAQCSSFIDFEDYAAGTQIGTQYDGVTFSSEPIGDCPPEIFVPSGGTASGTRALVVPGCDEFSNDYLRMVFDDSQRIVTFAMGDSITPDLSMRVRAYNAGGGLIYSQILNGGNGVLRLVTIGSAGGSANIKRVEVSAVVAGNWECIDDLRFGAPDDTPPDARIDSPGYGGCNCGEPIPIVGIACDDDGGYAYDEVSYRAVGALPEDPWTLIYHVVNDPICEPGLLWNWNVSSVPHGRYYLRLTAVNACGLSDVDYTSVFIDKQFGTVQVTDPPDNSTVCGVVDILGSVHDGCQCFDSYTVVYSDSIGGPFVPVDPANPVYTQDVKNGTLATWDTVAAGLPDDTYYFKVIGTDSCGNTDDTLFKLHLANGAGCGCPADLNENGDVDFNDLLIILATWGPCP